MHETFPRSAPIGSTSSENPTWILTLIVCTVLKYSACISHIAGLQSRVFAIQPKT